jgi:hypothetical protein
MAKANVSFMCGFIRQASNVLYAVADSSVVRINVECSDSSPGQRRIAMTEDDPGDTH